QPLQLLDRQRPPRPRHAVQRVARRRDGEGREDPRLQARRPRHARGRLGAGLLPGAAAALMAVAPPRPKKSERRQRMEAAGNKPLDWLEERSGIVGGLRYFLFRKVPGDTNWFHTLGSATLTAFLVQAVTGVILAMYYKPDPNSAYQSINPITNNLTLGWLVPPLAQWGRQRLHHPALLSQGAGVPVRRLQVPARAELDRRRDAARLRDARGVHRLPAAMGPDGVLGDRRRHQPERDGTDSRAVPGGLLTQ